MYLFAGAEQTSTAKVSAFFQKFYKTVYALRVNETNFASRKALIEKIFALESVSEWKNEEISLFSDCPQILEIAINP